MTAEDKARNQARAFAIGAVVTATVAAAKRAAMNRVIKAWAAEDLVEDVPALELMALVAVDAILGGAE